MPTPNNPEMNWPKIPSYVVTAVVVIISTLFTTYVMQKVNTEIDRQQTALIETLDNRLRALEASRFTQADADRTILYLEKQVDILFKRMDRIEQKLD